MDDFLTVVVYGTMLEGKNLRIIGVLLLARTWLKYMYMRFRGRIINKFLQTQ